MRARALLLALALGGCGRACAPAPATGAECTPRALRAVRAATPVTVDGKLEEEGWRQTPTSGAFHAEADAGVVAHTEVRALWDARGLSFALYAADEDEGSDDHLDVMLTTARGGALRWELPPTGPVRASVQGAQAAVDTDGTPNDPSDDDEEWTAELAVPWSLLGYDSPPREVRFDVARTDRPKGAATTHQRFGNACGGVLRLE